jgi:hypothetical protein
METMLILALIAAVCMCSRGGASGRDETWTKPSLSAGGEKSSQDDEKIRHNYLKWYIRDPGLVLREIIEEAEQQESTLKKFTLIAEQKKETKEPFTEDERKQFKPCIYGILGLKEDLDDDVFKSTFMEFISQLLLDNVFFCINPPPGIQRNDVKRVLDLMIMIKVAYF